MEAASPIGVEAVAIILYLLLKQELVSLLEFTILFSEIGVGSKQVIKLFAFHYSFLLIVKIAIFNLLEISDSK